jgi:acid phosphatase family membrane protein YuiD
MNSFIDLFQNRPLLATFLSWMIAQTIKVSINIKHKKRFNFRWFIEIGGMPSAHTASVVALATSVGISDGFASSFFAVSIVLALIVIFDAQFIRRNFGFQAKTLNQIVEDIYKVGTVKEERLKELIGHTPVEVFAGVMLGIVVGTIVS